MSAVLPSVAALLASLPGAMALTLASFAAGQTIQRLSRGHLLVNPVLLAILLVMSVLVWVEIPYPRYFASAAPLHFLLGPATVALAVPLYRHAAAVRAHIPQVLGAMAVGSAVATLVAIAVARALQAAPAILGSLLPKTVTTPVAMEIAARVGGVPGLTAVIVIVTGIFGYVFGPSLLDRAGVRDPLSRGLAYGTASHIMGVARAAQEGEETAAMAGFAMALNALLLAMALPALWLWIGGRP